MVYVVQAENMEKFCKMTRNLDAGTLLVTDEGRVVLRVGVVGTGAEFRYCLLSARWGGGQDLS